MVNAPDVGNEKLALHWVGSTWYEDMDWQWLLVQAR